VKCGLNVSGATVAGIKQMSGARLTSSTVALTAFDFDNVSAELDGANFHKARLLLPKPPINAVA
jgi:hypothetical protein